MGNDDARPPEGGNVEQKLLRRDDVCRRLGIGRTLLQDLVADKDSGFPRPVRVSRGRVAWLTAEIDAWAESRPRVPREDD